jgi:hypothetical protein
MSNIVSPFLEDVQECTYDSKPCNCCDYFITADEYEEDIKNSEYNEMHYEKKTLLCHEVGLFVI